MGAVHLAMESGHKKVKVGDAEKIDNVVSVTSAGVTANGDQLLRIVCIGTIDADFTLVP